MLISGLPFDASLYRVRSFIQDRFQLDKNCDENLALDDLMNDSKTKQTDEQLDSAHKSSITEGTVLENSHILKNHENDTSPTFDVLENVREEESLTSKLQAAVKNSISRNSPAIDFYPP